MPHGDGNFEIRNAKEVSLRNIEDLLVDTTRQVEARTQLRTQLDQSPTTMSYLRWVRRLPTAEKTRDVALVSSFTIETITPFLELEAYLCGWRIKPTFVQYARWQNALFDPD